MSSGWPPKHRQLFFQIFQEGAKVIELPLGGAASRFLDQRARVLVNEIESYYERVLESTPNAVPGRVVGPKICAALFPSRSALWSV